MRSPETRRLWEEAGPGRWGSCSSSGPQEELTWCGRSRRPHSYLGRACLLLVPQSSLPVLALHPFAWAISALPASLPSPPHPQHMWDLSPGCELLGGRPSINVKCCSRHRLCSLANGSLTRLAHPGLLEPLEAKTAPRHLTPGPQPDPDPSTQTSEAESDIFIKRLLKGRAGHTEGQDRTRGGQAGTSCSASLRVGSEVPQAQVGLMVEQIDQRSLGLLKAPGPLPSFTTPLHGGGQQQIEQVLEGQVSVGWPHHTGPGPAYQSHSGWASGASGWKAEDSESRPGPWGRGRLAWGAPEEKEGTYLLGSNGAGALGKCPRPSPGTHR